MPEAPATPARAEPAVTPSVVSVTFGKVVESVDVRVPLSTAYLVCVGCGLSDAALDFYHQAIAHAPAGTFRHDVPPGLKSAEATRAWLGTHLAAVKKGAKADDAATRPYARGEDLRQAVALAGSDLDRALGAATVAGLWFEERAANLFKDAVEALVAPAPLVKQVKSKGSAYILGCDVLGAG